MADATGGAPEVDVVDLDAAEAGGTVAPAGTEGNAGGADVVDLSEGEDVPRLPKQARTLPDGRVSLPLAKPVTLSFRRGADVRAETFDALTFRRLTGADMRAVMAAGNEAAIVAMQRSSDLSVVKFNAVFDRMDAADVSAASEVVGFLVTGGRTTGR